MNVATINIDYKYGDTFKLLPLADLHYDGRGVNSICDVGKLKKDLAERVDDKTIIIGIGDWFGGILPSDVKRYNKDLDATSSNRILDEQVANLAEIFMPYKSRIYALGQGNHEDTILLKCGTSLVENLIEKLSTPEHQILYMGYSWLLQLQFREANGRGRTMVIRGHHGWGGGSRTEGADITKYAHDVKFWQADLFIYGHVHRLKINDIEEGRMVGDSNWKTYLKRMVVAGTYQKTYSNKGTTYAEKRGYPPVTLRHPLIYLTPDRTAGVNIIIQT